MGITPLRSNEGSWIDSDLLRVNKNLLALLLRAIIKPLALLLRRSLDMNVESKQMFLMRNGIRNRLEDSSIKCFLLSWDALPARRCHQLLLVLLISIFAPKDDNTSRSINSVLLCQARNPLIFNKITSLDITSHSTLVPKNQCNYSCRAASFPSLHCLILALLSEIRLPMRSLTSFLR